MKNIHGTQIGDPVKASKAMYQLAIMKETPSKVALGSDSHQVVMRKLEDYRSMYAAHKDLSRSTDIEN